jgi:hypothetical protein
LNLIDGLAQLPGLIRWPVHRRRLPHFRHGFRLHVRPMIEQGEDRLQRALVEAIAALMIAAVEDVGPVVNGAGKDSGKVLVQLLARQRVCCLSRGMEQGG